MLSKVRKPENAWLLTWTVQEVFSKGERPAATACFRATRPSRSSTSTPTIWRPPARACRATRSMRWCRTKPTRRSTPLATAQKIFGGYKVHILSKGQVIDELVRVKPASPPESSPRPARPPREQQDRISVDPHRPDHHPRRISPNISRPRVVSPGSSCWKTSGGRNRAGRHRPPLRLDGFDRRRAHARGGAGRRHPVGPAGDQLMSPNQHALLYRARRGTVIGLAVADVFARQTNLEGLQARNATAPLQGADAEPFQGAALGRRPISPPSRSPPISPTLPGEGEPARTSRNPTSSSTPRRMPRNRSSPASTRHPGSPTIRRRSARAPAPSPASPPRA